MIAWYSRARSSFNALISSWTDRLLSFWPTFFLSFCLGMILFLSIGRSFEAIALDAKKTRFGLGCKGPAPSGSPAELHILHCIVNLEAGGQWENLRFSSLFAPCPSEPRPTAVKCG